MNNTQNNTSFLRKKAVKYMCKMASVKWTAQHDIDLTNLCSSLYYQEGETYYGVIYNTVSSVSYEQFIEYIDDNDVFIGPTDQPYCPGNQCVSSIAFAWKSIGADVSFTFNANMLPQSNTGVIAVGDYLWNKDDKTTTQMIERTPSRVLYDSYSKAVEGDALISCLGKTGHARMITDVCTVLSDNGCIDPIQSYVQTIEQTSLFDSTTKHKTTWYVDRRYTFEELQKTGYVPVSVPIFFE